MLNILRAQWPGALAGLVAIALGLAVAELAARLVDGASLVVAIGNIVIDNSPEAMSKWAIDTFGTKDKPVLIAGITVITLGIGTGAGVLSLYFRPAGMAVFAILAVVGGLAAADDALTSSLDAGITAAAAGIVAMATLPGLLMTAPGARATADDSDDDDGGDAAASPERRRFLYLTSGGLVAAAVAVPLVRRFIDTGVDVDAQRASIADRLRSSSRVRDAAATATATATPAAATPTATPQATATAAATPSAEDADDMTIDETESDTEPTPEGTPPGEEANMTSDGEEAEATPEQTPEATAEATPESTPEPTPEPTPDPTPEPRPGPETVRGISPLVTPNDRFYKIDTELRVPRIDSSDWSLKIKGMVDRDLEFSFDDLLDRSLQEESVTLACVSNDVGGNLVGNAYWLGVPLPTLLEEAGVQAGATQVVGRTLGGRFTVGFPTDVALDGRKSMVVIGMNGEPLPAKHGFPARLIIPGLYGYVSATKWLEEIELAEWDSFDAYWVGSRGWSKEGPIKLQSRIDVPDANDTLQTGNVRIAGVAWGGLRGVSGVQVRPRRRSGDGHSSDNQWLDGILSEELSDSSWRQWVVDWPATAGSFDLEVRAIDRSGMVQTAEEQGKKPDGATGHHIIRVNVRA